VFFRELSSGKQDVASEGKKRRAKGRKAGRSKSQREVSPFDYIEDEKRAGRQFLTRSVEWAVCTILQKRKNRGQK